MNGLVLGVLFFRDPDPLGDTAPPILAWICLLGRGLFHKGKFI